MKFHLDENVGHAIADGLLRHGFDVTTSEEAGLKSATDIEQLAYCLEAQCHIDSGSRHACPGCTGTQHAGIIYWQHGRRSLGKVIRKVVELASLAEDVEMQNRVEFL
jgi:formate dehydrogenase maturation protein FdhE